MHNIIEGTYIVNHSIIMMHDNHLTWPTCVLMKAVLLHGAIWRHLQLRKYSNRYTVLTEFIETGSEGTIHYNLHDCHNHNTWWNSTSSLRHTTAENSGHPLVYISAPFSLPLIILWTRANIYKQINSSKGLETRLLNHLLTCKDLGVSFCRIRLSSSNIGVCRRVTFPMMLYNIICTCSTSVESIRTHPLTRPLVPTITVTSFPVCDDS